MLETVNIPTRIREVEIKYKTVDTIANSIRVANSAEVYKTLGLPMLLERVEIFRCVLLDTKNRVICFEDVSRGSLSTSVVHPREVFTTPIRLQASAVIFLHNHPSGDPSPSREDRDCTERLVKAGQILGIKVLDHIIVGDSEYFSFADSSLINHN